MHPDLAEYGPVRFHSDPNALYDRHLVFDYAIDPVFATPRERYEAVARSLRDVLALRWLRTKKHHYEVDPKRAYYMSMEFLIGRSLASNVSNLLLDPAMQEACREKHVDWYELLDQEPDAGLGNGGLGRLAACFIESMATMDLPAMGYGLRYEYGIFRQEIRNGWQNERPDNWLRRPDPWEIVRLDHIVEVKLSCSFQMRGGVLVPVPGKPSTLLGIPFDRPVIGYGGRTINTLRLWNAGAPDSFHFDQFSHGDFVGAVTESLAAESITRVLYPDDSTDMGRELRFLQEYFLCACSVHDIVRRFRAKNSDWNLLPDKAAVQLNDTHPTMAIPELMRILLDEAEAGLGSRVGHHAAYLRLYQSHPAARGSRTLAGRLVRGHSPPAARNHLRNQPAFSRSRARSVSWRYGPIAAHEPDRRGGREKGAHGQSRHCVLAQHQWRRRDSHRPAEEVRCARFRTDVPRAF